MRIASYNVGTGSFEIVLDLLNERLIYNGTDKGALLATDLTDNFIGADGVWVGYGCHFTHCATKIDVAAIPEPADISSAWSRFRAA